MKNIYKDKLSPQMTHKIHAPNEDQHNSQKHLAHLGQFLLTKYRACHEFLFKDNIFKMRQDFKYGKNPFYFKLGGCDA